MVTLQDSSPEAIHFQNRWSQTKQSECFQGYMSQVNKIIYDHLIGDKTDNVLSLFGLSDDDQKKAVTLCNNKILI